MIIFPKTTVKVYRSIWIFLGFRFAPPPPLTNFPEATIKVYTWILSNSKVYAPAPTRCFRGCRTTPLTILYGYSELSDISHYSVKVMCHINNSGECSIPQMTWQTDTASSLERKKANR